MTKPKLSVVATAPAPATAEASPKFKIPLLTEMSPAEQRAFILEAHDAVLAHPLTLPDWTPSEVGMTVEEGLKVMLRNKLNPPDPHDKEAFRVEQALSYLGIELTPSRTRKLAELPRGEDVIDEELEVEYKQRYDAALFTVPNTVSGPRAIVGESATPIGYITRGLNSWFKAAKIAQKPLLKYYDLFHSLGFPLYSKSYRHLIDFNEVLANYKPYLAEAERDKHALKLKRATVRQLEDEAPEIVRLRAHNLILGSKLDSRTTIRDALVKARTDEDASERRMWRFRLQEAGIEVQYDEASCAGVVVHPDKLVHRNRLELSPYKKLLGGTIDGAREVRFELVV